MQERKIEQKSGLCDFNGKMDSLTLKEALSAERGRDCEMPADGFKSGEGFQLQILAAISKD